MNSVSLGLKGVQQHLSYDNLSNILEANLKMYYDWALLSIGGWSDVVVPTSGVYGGDFSRLRQVDDPAYTDGTVWEAPRKDFVWETGVNYTDPTGGNNNPQGVGYPIVNGNTVTGGYYVDYPNGRVIFDNAQTGPVYLPYSYRSVQIYRIDDAPWWRQIQYNSFRVDSDQLLPGSGDWSIMGVNRIQLPAVIIEVPVRGHAEGWSLGDASLNEYRDVVYYILAETPWERKNLVDIFNSQIDRTLILFDTNLASNYPLDYRGMLTGSANYPDLVSQYEWRKCEFYQSFISEVRQLHPSLYSAQVRTTTRTIV